MLKKYKLIAIIIPIIFLFFITLFNWNHIRNYIQRMNSQIIEFDNVHFKLSVVKTLKYPFKKEIRDYDTKRIEALYIEIGTLSDLKYFPNLKSLTVEDTDNEGLKEIGKCRSLEILTIGGEFSDVTPLSNLKNLKFLNIWSNEVKDFSPLGKLTQLEQLAININESKDIQFLSFLTNLEILLLGDTHELKDISPLVNLKNLVRLDLRGIFELEDIHPISKLTELKNLRILSCPKVTDISSIKNLNKLEILQLAHTGVTDLSVLGDLSEYPNLIRLALDDELIKDQEHLKFIRQEIDKRDRSNDEFYWKYDWLRSGDVKENGK